MEVVAEEASASAEDEVDCSAPGSWLVVACTCVSVCSEPGGVCELERLGPCSPELEAIVSDGMMLEVVCTGGVGELEVLGVCSPELETEVSACAGELGWDEVLGCSAADEGVVCGTSSLTLDCSG